MRAKAERDALLKQIAVLTSEPASEKQAAAR
jgi:hypothetical protein